MYNHLLLVVTFSIVNYMNGIVISIINYIDGIVIAKCP